MRAGNVARMKFKPSLCGFGPYRHWSKYRLDNYKIQLVLKLLAVTDIDLGTRQLQKLKDLFLDVFILQI